MPRNDLRANNTAGGGQFALKKGKSVSTGDAAILTNIATMEAYLLTQGFTQSYLDKMTKNDMVNEIRRIKKADLGAI